MIGSRAARSGLLALFAVLAACAPAAPAPVGAPVADPAALAARVATATTPASPRRVTFAWALNEQGSRASGRGVVRFEAPERLRLDLFGPRGETYLSAALVGEEFRFPAGAPPGLALPSPALLWAALGVVRPPAGAALASAATTDRLAILRYAAGGETFEFRAASGDTLALEEMERIGPAGVLESVRLERDARGGLARARYRDWAAYRDLELETENVEDVTSFPDAIWRPGGAR